MTTEERFWEKVDRRGPDECWPWRGGVVGNRAQTLGRYGRFATSTTRGNVKLALPHRYSWELHNGPVPAGLMVLHHCDNPSCVNPAHLWIGTAADNSHDMWSKGRSAAQLGKLNRPRRKNAA